MHFRSQQRSTTTTMTTRSFLLIFSAFIVLIVFLFSSMILLGNSDSRPIDVKSSTVDSHRAKLPVPLNEQTIAAAATAAAAMAGAAATTTTTTTTTTKKVVQNANVDIWNPIKVSFIIFPSMLGPETIQVNAARTLACLDTWWKYAQTEFSSRGIKFSVYVVQWYAGPDILTQTTINSGVNLVRVPERYNQSYATRVFFAMTVAERFAKPDFLVKVDDVTYVLVPNLARLLFSMKSSDVHIVGHRLQAPAMARPFLSGGAGYVVSRPVLLQIVELVKTQDVCLQREGGAEDVTLATCLYQHMQLTFDEGFDDGERFQAFCPLTLLGLEGGVYNFPVEWYSLYRERFGGVKSGEECCSIHTVSFHYVLPDHMRALHNTFVNRRVDVYFSPYEKNTDRLREFLLNYIDY